MLLDSQQISKREKQILTGLYLAKYDAFGLKKLGFGSFAEAFNVVGYALGAKPAAIKNYRDEFDPLFPNRRKGWHKRPTRAYCLKVYEEYRKLDLEMFAGLIRSFVGYDESIWSQLLETPKKGEAESHFAKRLVTGLAAENYFESVRLSLPEFQGCSVENTTKLGCGFDFRLWREERDAYLAVEVKGLTERTGNLLLTPKEYEVASKLAERYFLFVVKNFREQPSHIVYNNPLSSALRFTKKERVTVQVAWFTNI